jgi:hypothetical protein
MMRRALLTAMAALAIVACDTQPQGYPGQVTTTFDGNKQLIIVARWGVNAMAIGITAWADVAGGTPGTIELTGPWHMRCEGKFVTPPAGNAYPENLPFLDIGEGSMTAPGFHAPAGDYKAVVAIPSHAVSITKSFKAGHSFINPITNTYDPPGICLLIADTRQQLADLTREHVHAVSIWVARMDASASRTQLIPLAQRADDAATAGDRAGALDAMANLKNLAEPVKDQNQFLYRDIRVSLGLLTQPLPGS